MWSRRELVRKVLKPVQRGSLKGGKVTNSEGGDGGGETEWGGAWE